MERNYFYLTEFSDVILDIREQFPLLPQEETIVIAEELGIKHPADPKTGDPIVMTTDFLLTVDKGQGITVVKAKHSSKGIQHRAEVLSRINGK